MISGHWQSERKQGDREPSTLPKVMATESAIFHCIRLCIYLYNRWAFSRKDSRKDCVHLLALYCYFTHYFRRLSHFLSHTDSLLAAVRMRRQGTKSNGNDAKSPTGISPPPPSAGKLSDAALFLQSMQDPEIIERVRTTITNAHAFKLPPRQSASVGWRGADWKEKVWQGTVKVVERGDMTAVLLVDRTKGSIFAVCPFKEGAVERCVDSSRYFVLRIENANGRHMFIGVAFNERNDAFDFNTALEDSRREREMEQTAVPVYTGPPKDYSIKDGEKIKVSIPKTGFGKYHGRSAWLEGNVTQVWNE